MKWIGLPLWFIILAMFGPFYFWFMLADELARKRGRERQKEYKRPQSNFVKWYQRRKVS